MRDLQNKLQNSESLIASAEAAASISRAEAGCYRTEIPFLMQHTDSRQSVSADMYTVQSYDLPSFAGSLFILPSCETLMQMLIYTSQHC